MTDRPRAVLLGLIVALLSCATVTGWGLRDLLVARDCLTTGRGVPGWTGTTIESGGCSIHSQTRGMIFVPLHGPSFAPTVLAMLVGVVLLALTLLMAHRLRRHARLAGQPS
jgi:hypothetical protein